MLARPKGSQKQKPAGEACLKLTGAITVSGHERFRECTSQEGRQLSFGSSLQVVEL